MMTQSLFDQGPPAPCPAPFNMAAYILSAGLKCPDKAALEVLSHHTIDIWTYRRLTQAVLATAGALQTMGLQPGARILLRLGNEVSFPILYLGAIAGGFVPVPSSSQLTAPEVAALVADLEPALICVGAGMATPDDLPCPLIDANAIADMAGHAPGQYVYGNPDRLAYIIYTSGTSGKPRAVEHAHRAIWARRMMWQGWYDIGPDDRLCHAGAFNWTYTLGTGLCDPWAVGATALIPRADIDHDALLGLLKTHRASIFAAAPGVFRRVLKTASIDTLPDLRHALSAGEKLSPAVQKGWEERTGTQVFEALGMSEVSTFISSHPGMALKGGASGKPQKGRRIAVLDAGDHSVAETDAPGILAVSNRDPGLMLGYRGAARETADKFVGEWFLTGDTVSMDAQGYVTYLGRDDDMMNAGGYRVSPIEVETVLNSHPDILEAAAVAVEIKADTFVIAAFYHSDVKLTADTLAAFCKTRLAGYKCPRLFVACNALPKGANGKLRRADLRAGFKDTT